MCVLFPDSYFMSYSEFLAYKEVVHKLRERQRLLRSQRDVSTRFAAIAYPEPSSFLLRMLDENEGLWKGPILRRS